MQNTPNVTANIRSAFHAINHALCLLDNDLTPIIATDLFCLITDQPSKTKLVLNKTVIDTIRLILKNASQNKAQIIAPAPIQKQIVLTDKIFVTNTYILTIIPFNDAVPESELARQPLFLIELQPISSVQSLASSFNSYKGIISKLAKTFFKKIDTIEGKKHINLSDAMTAAISYFDNILPPTFNISNNIKESLLLDISLGEMLELLFRIILEAIDFSSAQGSLVFSLGSNAPQKTGRIELYTFVNREFAFLNIDSLLKIFIENTCSYTRKIYENKIRDSNLTTTGNRVCELPFPDAASIEPGTFEFSGVSNISSNLKELQKLVLCSDNALKLQLVRFDLLVIRLSIPLVNQL